MLTTFQTNPLTASCKDVSNYSLFLHPAPDKMVCLSDIHILHIVHKLWPLHCENKGSNLLYFAVHSSIKILARQVEKSLWLINLTITLHEATYYSIYRSEGPGKPIGCCCGFILASSKRCNIINNGLTLYFINRNFEFLELCLHLRH